MSDLRTLAARSNAQWCDAVCRANALRPTFGRDLWSCAQRTPLFYPDAVTLREDIAPAAVLAAIDGATGASVKDSFAALDLSSDGFEVLFEAEWIAHTSATSAPREHRWRRVADAAALTAWRAVGTPAAAIVLELLRASQVVLLVAEDDGGPTARAALDVSPEAVGISNVATRAQGLEAVWRDLVGECADRFPGLPIVGYETSDDVLAPLAGGFRRCGPLRVWLRS